MSCPLRPNHRQYVTYGVVTIATESTLNIQSAKACDLAESCNCNSILIKITSLPATTTNTIKFVTCCGTSIPAVTASANAPVTVAMLNINYWYEVRIVRGAAGYQAVFVVL